MSEREEEADVDAPAARRKRRTRAHVLADLSANHVEQFILACGFSAEQTRHDYGVDMFVFFYDADGQIKPGMVQLQLKASDGLTFRDDGDSIAFDLTRADLENWLATPEPVALIVFQPSFGARWLYVQSYFEAKKDFDLSAVPSTIRVYVPRRNVVDAEAIRTFERFNDDVIAQQRGKISHHE